MKRHRVAKIAVLLLIMLGSSQIAAAETVEHLGLEWTSSGIPLIYESAVDYCNSLSSEGHDDWRLPSINELHTLYEPRSPRTARIRPGISLAHDIDFEEMEAKKNLLIPDFFRVWSSTRQVGNVDIYDALSWSPDRTWVFSFQEGRRSTVDARQDSQKRYSIETLCVRGSATQALLANEVAVRFERPSSEDLIGIGSYGDLTLLQALLRRDPKIFKDPGVGVRISLLHAVSAAGLLKICRFCIEEARCDVNAASVGLFNDATALYYASEHSHRDVVEYLLAKQANPNALGGQFGSPLHAAVARGHLEIVQMLLAAGSDPELKAKNVTPLKLAYDTLRAREEHDATYGSEEDQPPFASLASYKEIIKKLRVEARQRALAD